ncbi:MAG: hypothetical protein RJB22_2070 [Pseudomonadota bacterium]
MFERSRVVRSLVGQVQFLYGAAVRRDFGPGRVGGKTAWPRRQTHKAPERAGSVFAVEVVYEA